MNDNLLKTIDDHSYPPEKENTEVREVREKVKQRTINETAPIPRIYDKECEKVKSTNVIIAISSSEREASTKHILHSKK